MPARRRFTQLVQCTAAATLLLTLQLAIDASQSRASGGGLASTATTSAETPTSVSAWGENSGGELGDGSFEQSDTPVATGGVSGAQAISAGDRFSLALLSGGTVLAWGENQFGQLGDGSTTDRAAAVPVKGLSGATAVSAGGGHSLALLSDGKVMAWGDNTFGQLGDGNTADSSTPVEVKGLTGVTAIAAGQLDSLALLSDGRVMAWGDDDDGQLGDGNTGNSATPVEVSGLTGVKAIAAGGVFSLALLKNATVDGWGSDEQGELGSGAVTSSPVAVKGVKGVTAISAGFDFALALLKSGTVEAWGENRDGQLGPGTGQEEHGPVKVTGVSGVTAVSAGGTSGLALLSGGTVESWGLGALGQLGTGEGTRTVQLPSTIGGLSEVSAIANGDDHALALRSAAAPAAPTLSEAPWQVISTPFPGTPPDGLFDAAPRSVAAASADDAWAVGTIENEEPTIPFAEHWNGTSWSIVPVPAPSGANRNSSLTGVLDFGPSDAWAVGKSETEGRSEQRTLIEHWNGTAWSVVKSPDPLAGAAGNDGLTAIDGVSEDDIWAVGEDFVAEEGAAVFLLFEHWNGKKWTAVKSKITGFASAITTISTDDAWVVGANEGLSETLAAHWNGKTWKLVATPSLQDGATALNELSGVSAVSSEDVWASARESNVNGSNFRKPYALHWNGKAWELVNAPNPGDEGSEFRGIAALSPDDVWAVGQTQENDGSILDLTERFNGSSWQVVPSPSPGEGATVINSGLKAAASTGGGIVWAVGSQNVLGDCCTQPLALENPSG